MGGGSAKRRQSSNCLVVWVVRKEQGFSEVGVGNILLGIVAQGSCCSLLNCQWAIPNCCNKHLNNCCRGFPFHLLHQIQNNVCMCSQIHKCLNQLNWSIKQSIAYWINHPVSKNYTAMQSVGFLKAHHFQKTHLHKNPPSSQKTKTWNNFSILHPKCLKVITEAEKLLLTLTLFFFAQFRHGKRGRKKAATKKFTSARRHWWGGGPIAAGHDHPQHIWALHGKVVRRIFEDS